MFDTIDIETIPLSQALLITLADPFVLLCIAIGLFIIIYLLRNRPDWHQLAARLNSRPWSAREAETMILAVIAFILAGKAAITALSDIKLIPEEQIESCLLVAQTVLFHLPVLVMILVILIRNKTIASGILGYSLQDIRHALRLGLIFCLAALPVVGLVSIVQIHLFSKLGLPNEPQYVIQLLSGPGPLWIKIYLVIVTIITAPIAEEFIFRGIGISALSEKIGLKWTIVLISTAFAMIHLNLYSFMPLFTIAVAFSLAYVYSGSLLVPVFMHSIFNTLNLVGMFLASQGQN